MMERGAHKKTDRVVGGQKGQLLNRPNTNYTGRRAALAMDGGQGRVTNAVNYYPQPPH